MQLAYSLYTNYCGVIPYKQLSYINVHTQIYEENYRRLPSAANGKIHIYVYIYTYIFFSQKELRRALENSLNTKFFISLQVNNTQYKFEIGR